MSDEKSFYELRNICDRLPPDDPKKKEVLETMLTKSESYKDFIDLYSRTTSSTFKNLVLKEFSKLELSVKKWIEIYQKSILIEIKELSLEQISKFYFPLEKWVNLYLSEKTKAGEIKKTILKKIMDFKQSFEEWFVFFESYKTDRRDKYRNLIDIIVVEKTSQHTTISDLFHFYDHWSWKNNSYSMKLSLLKEIFSLAHFQDDYQKVYDRAIVNFYPTDFRRLKRMSLRKIREMKRRSKKVSRL